MAEIYNVIISHGLGGLILIFLFFNFKPKSMAGGKGGGKGRAPPAAAAEDEPVTEKPAKRGRSIGGASSSKRVMDDAAADAAAELAAVTPETESKGGEGAAAVADTTKRQSLPDGLLERRLDKANTEKNAMATKIAELEKQLAEKDVSAQSPRPGTGPKVEHRLIL